MDFIQYISKDALILIPILWIIGIALKRTTYVMDNVIPIILLVIAVALSNGLLGVGMSSTIQGILVGGSAVGINAAKKQIEKM